MIIQSILTVLYAFVIVPQLAHSAEISYNLPNLSSSAEWDPNGITVSQDTTAIMNFWALFVDKNDTIYAVSVELQEAVVYEWRSGSNSPTRIIFKDLAVFTWMGLFILSTGDIYVNDYLSGRIKKWTAESNTTETITQFCRICAYIFIAVNDAIYCSMYSHHQVIAKLLFSNSTIITAVAGVHVQGSEANMLSNPSGIFVNINLDLYVADTGNNRVQLFHAGESRATTVAGVLSDALKLYEPRYVVLDMSDHIYIVDSGNNRIMVKTPYNFRCLIGCSKLPGLSSDRLYQPTSMAFDSFGNIHVTSPMMQRIQKFTLLKNIFDSPNNTKMTATSTSTTGTPIPTLSESTFASILNTHSPTYLEICSKPMYFYAIIQIHVFEEESYKIVVNSTVEIYVNLYKNKFDPMNPDGNLFLRPYGDCGFNQINFTSLLQPNEKYELIVATIYPSATSAFSVITMGPSNIILNRRNISETMQTIYSSNVTTNSHRCSHFNCTLLNSYCEINQIHVSVEGDYAIIINSTVALNGYAYENNFTLFNLSMNAIKESSQSNCVNHFRLSLYRQMNTSFILAVATSKQGDKGTFSIIVNGPSKVTFERIDTVPAVIETNYSSELNNNSKKHNHQGCVSPAYYYEALEIYVNISGYYMLFSKSDFDAYGYLYEHYFEPLNPIQTFLIQNDNSCENDQFKITTYLRSNMKYVLVVTYAKYQFIMQNGEFTVIIKGPDRVHMKQIDNNVTIVGNMYDIDLTETSPQLNHEDCRFPDFFYNSVQIDIVQSGYYSFASFSLYSIVGYLYERHFNPHSPFERLLTFDNDGCGSRHMKVTYNFQSNVTYILVTSIKDSHQTDRGHVFVSGPNYTHWVPIILQTMYTSKLMKETPVYPRVCGRGNYHYETIEVNVQQSGSYTFDSNTSILLYGYIYDKNFDPSYPNQNLIAQSNFSCTNPFKVGSYLQVNSKYILVVTTFDPDVIGSFIIFVSGPNNVTLNQIMLKHSSCVVGDQCSLYTKGIGMTINDILRNQIQPNISFGKQSVLVQIAAAITMIMFAITFVNGSFSLITFQNKQLRKVGCGLYLLASSITSLLTITMFTIKFWFVVLIQLHSIVSSSILRVDCIFLGPVLKVFLYLDGWLNACVAIERTVNVSKGVNFNKKMSRRMARWIILILPILITLTVIHEPIHHELFEYTTQRYKPIENNSTEKILTKNDTNGYEIENNVLCVIRYSRAVQTYNTITLFFHLVVPFLANLGSASFIIFGTARQRSAAQNTQTFKEHVFKQMSEHKQLLISPLVLLILAMPRLIISLVSGCVDPSTNPWLYLCAYFISFTPPMLIFIVFVLPSELYTKTFKESITRWRRQIRQ